MDIDRQGTPVPCSDRAIASAASPSALSCNRLRKVKRVACKECRQAKSRCDVIVGQSSPCSRCRKLIHKCQIDVVYKRITKRIKFDELAQQVQHLQSVLGPNRPALNALDTPSEVALVADSLGLPQAAGSSPSLLIPSTSNTANALQSQEYVGYIGSVQGESPTANRPIAETTQPLTPDSHCQSSSYQGSSHQAYVLEPLAMPTTRARSIGHINLGPEQVNVLFRIYFEHYHPFFCILDPKFSPDEHFTRSPLLFWAVISVASRRFEEDPTLLEMLSRTVTSLVWSSLSVLPHTCFIVQAIALLCMWPFPTSSMWTDSSFMFISAAKSAALQMGLHRPENIQDFSRTKYRLSPDGVQETTKIWSACFIAGQCITSAYGQEPLFKPDRTIDHACELGSHYTLPDNLRHQLLITRLSTQVSTLMSENAQDDSSFSSQEQSNLLARLEQNLDDLQGQLEGELAVSNQIWLSCARLQLRVYYFYEKAASEGRKRGLLKAFETASSLIAQITAADANSRFLPYAPNYLYRMLILATIILLKILNSTYSPYVDCLAGKQMYNASLLLLRRCSVENNDNIGRASKILTQLWGVYKSLARRAEEPSSCIRTRLGAGILHDALWLWRQEFGGQENPYRATPDNETAHSQNNSLAFPNAAETISSTLNDNSTTTNRADTSDFMTGLDSDTDWIFNLGLADMDFSSIIRLPASHFQE